MSHDNENKKCLCACHINKLKKPYEHDTKCCDEMNGFIPTPPSEVSSDKIGSTDLLPWEEIYDDRDFYCIEYLDTLEEIKDFIKKEVIPKVREEAKREEQERIIELVKAIPAEMPEYESDQYDAGMGHMQHQVINLISEQ